MSFVSPSGELLKLSLSWGPPNLVVDNNYFGESLVASCLGEVR